MATKWSEEEACQRVRYFYALQAIVGLKAEVVTTDGEVFGGTFHTATPFEEETQRFVFKTAKPQKDMEHLGSTLVIDASKLASASVPVVAMQAGPKSAAFSLEAVDVALDSGWLSAQAPLAKDTYGEALEARRMEAVPYTDDLYTTSLDARGITTAQKKRAERIADEIMKGATSNIHVAEERGLINKDLDDEEERYSSVIRQTEPVVSGEEVKVAAPPPKKQQQPTLLLASKNKDEKKSEKKVVVLKKKPVEATEDKKEPPVEIMKKTITEKIMPTKILSPKPAEENNNDSNDALPKPQPPPKKKSPPKKKTAKAPPVVQDFKLNVGAAEWKPNAGAAEWTPQPLHPPFAPPPLVVDPQFMPPPPVYGAYGYLPELQAPPIGFYDATGYHPFVTTTRPPNRKPHNHHQQMHHQMRHNHPQQQWYHS